VECHFSGEKVKCQGHRTSKTPTAICRHVYLRPANRAPTASALTAGWAWPGISKRHAARSNWKDGRIPCRRRRLCLLTTVYIKLLLLAPIHSRKILLASHVLPFWSIINVFLVVCGPLQALQALWPRNSWCCTFGRIIVQMTAYCATVSPLPRSEH